MKQTLTLMLFTWTIVNCSTHPEIKPYEPSENSSLELNQDSKSLISDSVFNNESLALDDDYYDETPTEFDDSIDSVSDGYKQSEAQVESKNIKIGSSGRGIASTSQNGFYRFTRDCEMRSSPEDTSAKAGQVSQGKRLWLDAHDSKWFKAYKKSGPVFVSHRCVEPN